MNTTLACLNRLLGDFAHAPDGQLLDAFLAGNQPAFRELVERHGSLVFAVCSRILRQQQDAEDAFQAVFLVLARRAADVWPRDAVGSWLYGVAYRVALKARTQRFRKQRHEQPLEDVAAPPVPELEPDTAEVIHRAVRKLPELYRAAVVACDLEGLSRAEAAVRLGWKEGTLSGRLARARELLAQRLRKVGLTLPAAGLAAVLGTATPIRAELLSSVLKVTSGRAIAEIPAPVAALTEGVVPSMIAFKLKVAALMVACTLGLGYSAWASATGDGPGVAPGTNAAVQPLFAQPVPAPPKPKAAPPAAPKPAALELLQGRWRVLKLTSDGKEVPTTDLSGYPVIEIAGNTFAMPYRDTSTGWRVEKIAIAVDDKPNPKTIDFIHSGKPVGRGVYEFTAPAKNCASCHESPWKGAAAPVTDLVPICTPGQKANTGMRLAVASTGPRPAKFDSKAEGVVEFQLVRVTADDELLQLERQRAQLEAYLNTVEGARREEQKAELDRLTEKLRLLQLLRAKTEAEKTEAEKQVHLAQAQVEQAQASALVAQAQLAIAKTRLKEAQDRLAAAEKAATAAGKTPATPTKEGETFTVHVRPLAAPEKVIRVKATGKETVLEGLAYAAENMAINADTVSVWVVRGKEVRAVDLAAVYKGDAKTNYTLQPGDQIFVQVKIGK